MGEQRCSPRFVFPADPGSRGVSAPPSLQLPEGLRRVGKGLQGQGVLEAAKGVPTAAPSTSPCCSSPGHHALVTPNPRCGSWTPGKRKPPVQGFALLQSAAGSGTPASASPGQPLQPGALPWSLRRAPRWAPLVFVWGESRFTGAPVPTSKTFPAAAPTLWSEADAAVLLPRTNATQDSARFPAKGPLSLLLLLPSEAKRSTGSFY